MKDQFAQQKVVISYCPVCGTGIAFNVTVNNTDFKFGVSGLLFNSDVLMYDRQTQSLWSQIKQQAISGQMSAHKLKMLPIEHTTWADWVKRHPKTQVLSFKIGHIKNYNRSPYAGYKTSPSYIFP